MFRTLLLEVRIWPVLWRRRLFFYRLSSDRDQLGFVAMLGLPLLAIATIVLVAFNSRPVAMPAATAAPRVPLVDRRALDLQCLAENIYFEARGEPVKGQVAVGEVTLNRLRSRHFPKTVCKVVHDSRWDPSRKRFVAHFSWTDLEMLNQPHGPAWEQAKDVAIAVYDEINEPVVPDALFYHATSVNPIWARNKQIVAKIGNHIFYR
jgi:N-acetylmuramoyl-L-alanine amidase